MLSKYVNPHNDWVRLGSSACLLPRGAALNKIITILFIMAEFVQCSNLARDDLSITNRYF
jgi:hypothetical protein